MNCNMMTRSLRCISTEMRDLPTYDGLGEVDAFLDQFEREVREKQQFEALNWVLRAMPARWWGTHKGKFDDWRACRRLMPTRFGKTRGQSVGRCNGWNSLRVHLLRWAHAYDK